MPHPIAPPPDPRAGLALPAGVTICEVGPRDGLQMEKTFIPTAAKVALIDGLSATGIGEIQATSFVHPSAVPQMADAEEVISGIARRPGVRYTALVPNERGAARAVAAGVDAIDLVVSATDSHCLANTRMTTDQAMQRARGVARLGAEANVEVRVGFATALGCPFEGFPPYERVERLVGAAVETLGARHVNIADTVGMADPQRVHGFMRRLIGTFAGVTFSLHLHDTRGMGLANVLAGLEAGVTNFDASIAGLGGCPYAPGASGNISSEDCVHMLEAMGVRTGIDLGALLAEGARAKALVGHADSALLEAGPARALGPYRAPVAGEA